MPLDSKVWIWFFCQLGSFSKLSNPVEVFGLGKYENSTILPAFDNINTEGLGKPWNWQDFWFKDLNPGSLNLPYNLKIMITNAVDNANEQIANTVPSRISLFSLSSYVSSSLIVEDFLGFFCLFLLFLPFYGNSIFLILLFWQL